MPAVAPLAGTGAAAGRGAAAARRGIATRRVEPGGGGVVGGAAISRATGVGLGPAPRPAGGGRGLVGQAGQQGQQVVGRWDGDRFVRLLRAVAVEVQAVVTRQGRQIGLSRS